MKIFLSILMVLSFSSVSLAQEKSANSAEEKKGIKKFLKYDPEDKTVPVYRKVCDEYILDLEQLEKTGQMPLNEAKDRDLARMSKEGGIKLY